MTSAINDVPRSDIHEVLGSLPPPPNEDETWWLVHHATETNDYEAKFSIEAAVEDFRSLREMQIINDLVSARIWQLIAENDPGAYWAASNADELLVAQLEKGICL